jgi:2-polyprenyl-3-methyl-5-hydroxy-6-metoxy-1,4-benzoquinol methylase
LAFIYETEVDPTAENNSHAFALSFIGCNKHVLEVGCATGYLTKVLVERGCTVIGIEIDPEAAEVAEQWAERVVVGNIDEGDVWNYVKDESFDVVVMGDVLEHLREPLTSLRQAVRKLKPSGFVVTSLPNIAHGDVRIALLNGRFRYNESGLLDRTHVHFFTLESIRQMMSEAGLVVVDTERVVMPLFQSEIGVTRDDVNHKTLDELHEDPEVESYQYVMKSVRDNGSTELAMLSRRVSELGDRVHNQRMRVALLRKGLMDNAILRDALAILQDGVAEHQRYIKALEGHVSGLEHNIAVLTESLAASDARYHVVLGQRTPLSRSIYNRIRRVPRKSG